MRYQFMGAAEFDRLLFTGKATSLMLYCCLAVEMLLSGCTATHKSQVKDDVTGPHSTLPDYSNLYYWAAHPSKRDASDSIPKPLRKSYVRDSSVDVFFIYPTSYINGKAIATQPRGGNLWNADVNDNRLNAITDYSSILNQASAFNQLNVYAPRYRQAHYEAFFIEPAVAKPFFDTAYQDVKTAFLYYLEHYNHGRPFIIAAHSQGTIHAEKLLKEFIDGKPLAQKLVCAYLLGMPVRNDYFNQLQPCTDSLQTGCFVSWRTFREGYNPMYIAQEPFKTYVVNPLTWTMDYNPASAKLNEGSIFYKFNKVKKYNVTTQIHGNLLWSTKPHFFGSVFLRTKDYHIGDVNLFWMNIRRNLSTRVRSYRQHLEIK